MRYAVLGDVHGNYYALEAVIKNIIDKYDSEITGFIFTGDYVGDFADGSKVVDLIQRISEEYKTYIIKGNREIDQVGTYLESLRHDKEPDWDLDSTMGAALISCRELGKERLKYLKSLPISCIIRHDGKRPIFVKHKMPLDPNEIELVKRENMVVITGHTHEAHKETKDGVSLYNPGSIGLPDDGIIAASYGIMESNDNGDWTFNICDLEYDYNKELESLKNNSDLYNRCCGWGKALELALTTGVNCPSLYANESRRLATLFSEAEEKGVRPEFDDVFKPYEIYRQNRSFNVNYDGSYLTDMGLQDFGNVEVFGPTEVVSVGTKPNNSAKPTKNIYLMALDNVKRQTMLASREKVFLERHEPIVK